MNKEEWIWMPHAGHFCGGNECRFRLNTYVNGYIVSTVGEYLPPLDTLKSLVEIKNKHGKFEIDEKGKLTRKTYMTPEEMEFFMSLKGDALENAYLYYFGYYEIGLGRTYETMVFLAKKQDDSNYQCCPWIAHGDFLILKEYTDAVSAFQGHMTICEEFSKKKSRGRKEK